MNILITGGTGVIGSWVTRRLVSEGIRPVVLSRRDDPALVADILDRVDRVRGDIGDLGLLIRTVRDYGIERIIHMSALMPPQCQADPVAAYHVNCGGTMNVLEAARSMGIGRVIYASAKGVYGTVPPEAGHPQYRPLSEDSPKNPVSVYDVTKLYGEHIGQNYRRNWGIEFVSLRFSTTYGPGKLARHGPMSIHSKIIENGMLGKPTTVRGGDQKDDMIYMADVAQGIVKAALSATLRHPVYNIGSGRLATLHDVADAVRRLYPQAPIAVEGGMDYMGIGPNYSLYDCRRAEADFGYRPEYDVARGVADYVQSMERLGLVPEYTP